MVRPTNNVLISFSTLCTSRYYLWKTLWKLCKLLFEVHRGRKNVTGKIYKFVISCGPDLL